jgi:hypothetical protein
MVHSWKRRIGLLIAVTGIFAMTASFAVADDRPVSGVYKANGQEAKLAYVSASKGDPPGDKPTIVLVFTEKDQSKDKNPRFNAMFGKLGSALIITIDKDGNVVGCQVAHSALKNSGLNAIGDIKMSDFKIENGKIQGKLSTGGEVEAFREKWEVDIKFQAQAP